MLGKIIATKNGQRCDRENVYFRLFPLLLLNGPNKAGYRGRLCVHFWVALISPHISLALQRIPPYNRIKKGTTTENAS